MIPLALAKGLALMLPAGAYRSPWCFGIEGPAAHFSSKLGLSHSCPFSVFCVSNRHHNGLYHSTKLAHFVLHLTFQIWLMEWAMIVGTGRKEVVAECGWSKPRPFHEYLGWPGLRGSWSHAHRVQLS